MGKIYQRRDGTLYVESEEFAQSEAFERLHQRIQNKVDNNMDQPEVTIEHLYDDSVGPKPMTGGSVGLDLFAHRIIHRTNTEVWYGTGIAATVSHPLALFAFARSSISETDPRVELANGVGVIDRDYRGEIQVRFNFVHPKHVYDAVPYEPGDRIAQMVPMVAPSVKLVEADSLDETERGSGGFGSTGR